MNELQRTEEWHQHRLGKVTASRIADLTARGRGGNGWGLSRSTYMAQLLTERLTGQPEDGFKSAYMAWGIETEPQAVAAYTFETGRTVEMVGFHNHRLIQMAGASPDGFVGDDGLIEVKCPKTTTHIDTLTKQQVPGGYIKQMQWQMACTGRSWCDFVSFDPRVPVEFQLFIQRVERDAEVIEFLEQSVRDFLKELAEKIADLHNMKGA